MLIQLSTCTEKPPRTWATAPHYGEAESSAHQHPQRQWPVTDDGFVDGFQSRCRSTPVTASYWLTGRRQTP